jgi:hypothetical protein
VCVCVHGVCALTPVRCGPEVRFDFPLLLCELLRHGLSCTPFERWLFVDTLVALQAARRHGCLKLQCLSLRVMADTGRAHRALDDCVSLRQVVVAAAIALGIPPSTWLRDFAQELDVPPSVAQLSVLMDCAGENSLGVRGYRHSHQTVPHHR